MPVPISMWLYKNPKFRESYEEIIQRIKEDEDFKQYKWWLNFEFHVREGIGYIYCNAYNVNYSEEQQALDVWGRICYKYFFNPVI